VTIFGVEVTISERYVLVKAPLRVHYVNCSTRGVVEGQIKHEAKLSAIFASRPHPSCYNSRSVRA